MSHRKYEFYKEQLRGVSFPYAVLDIELFHNNIEENLKRAGEKKVRVASKSIRCAQVLRRIFEYSTQFEGIMAYHGDEVLYLAQKGFDNLLMGYPIVDSKLIEAIGKETKKGKYICLMVDSREHLAMINEVGKKLNVKMPVCVDIDLSDNYPGLRFGVWRSGISNLHQLETFLGHLKQTDYVQLDGLMGYEAQVAGVGDNVVGNTLKNTVVRWLKQRSIKHLRKLREEAVELIASQGHQLRFVNGGGTGSLESTAPEPAVTEVTIGSGFYAPHLFDYYQNFELSPALFYAIPIVRKPTSDVYTCHGGGFIASGGIEQIKAPIVYLPQTGKLDKMEGAGEVQTPIRFGKLGTTLQIGDPIFLRHAKAGELCERFNKIIFLENEGLLEVPTYRGDGQSFG